MILVFQREREEGGIVVKILEILNGNVIHLEHQCRRIMHLEEDQPAVHRPRPFKHSGRPIKRSRTMHQEEDHERPMHPEEGEPGVRVYGENCASVVGIYRSTTLFSSLLSHSAYYVRFLFLNCVFAI